MDNLKKYRELLLESSIYDEAFSVSFDRTDWGGNASLDIDNPPSAWGYPYVTGGKARWELDLDYRSSGLDINGAKLVSLYFTFTVEDPETGEEMDDEVEIDLGFEDLSGQEMESSIGKPGYYLNILEVNMNGSEDPKKWKYSLDIGS